MRKGLLMCRRERGFLLISMYMIVMVLFMLSLAMTAHAVAEVRAAQRSQASMQALYLAEGGVDLAITQLRQDYNWTGGEGSGANGDFSVNVQVVGTRRRITAQGNNTMLGDTITRPIEAIVQQSIPPSFYDNIIWAAQNLNLKGNAYQITGDIRHADTSPSNTNNVNGTVTYDPAANPLPRLSFQQIYDIAEAQGNIYDEARLASGPSVFPTSFWYRQPGTEGPTDPGYPNVNYVTTDLVLNGNIGTIGGFFVVVGNVLTNPSAVEDTTINGNGEIEGAVYTTGNFRVNGGGNGLNIHGGVWSGAEARVNGNATLDYNSAYMNAIKTLNINADVQVISWQDLSS